MSKRLGITFRDKISGFQGVATAHCKYITGCNQTLLAPKSSDGKAVESCWFDDQRLEEVKGVPRIVLDNGGTPGCDIPAPIR